jgi:hypothetical protein
LLTANKIEYGTKPFEYFWLNIPDQFCSLCGTERMWTFIVTPIVSLVCTIIFTMADIGFRTMRGIEPRAPIIAFKFDKLAIDENAAGDEKAVNDDNDSELEA